MKNVSKILMFIFIAGLCLTACQKEEMKLIKVKIDEPIEYVEGRLHFNNSEQLTNRINNLKKT